MKTILHLIALAAVLALTSCASAKKEESCCSGHEKSCCSSDKTAKHVH